MKNVELTQEQQFRHDAETARNICCDLFSLDLSDNLSIPEKTVLCIYHLSGFCRDQLLEKGRISDASIKLLDDLCYDLM